MTITMIPRNPGHPMQGQRVSIRHNGVLLAVPPIHPATPRSIRVHIFELVLRRLYCEALELAEFVADELEGRTAQAARTRALMAGGKSWEMGEAA